MNRTEELRKLDWSNQGIPTARRGIVDGNGRVYHRLITLDLDTGKYTQHTDRGVTGGTMPLPIEVLWDGDSEDS